MSLSLCWRLDEELRARARLLQQAFCYRGNGRISRAPLNGEGLPRLMFQTRRSMSTGDTAFATHLSKRAVLHCKVTTRALSDGHISAACLSLGTQRSNTPVGSPSILALFCYWTLLDPCVCVFCLALLVLSCVSAGWFLWCLVRLLLSDLSAFCLLAISLSLSLSLSLSRSLGSLLLLDLCLCVALC